MQLALRRLAVAAFLTTLALVSPSSGPAGVQATHSSSPIGLLAVDAVTAGNTATSLGTLDGCRRLELGSSLDVDYVVDSIPLDRPMIAFEARLTYDPEILEVIAVDHDLLLAARGTYSPFAGLSDELPDTDGDYRVSVLDTASSTEPQANVEAGPGVLARITLRAKSAGVSDVAILVQRDPLIYPLVQDTQNEMIFAQRLGSAVVAVGEDCPPGAAQEPDIEDLASVNEEILADNPDLAPPGGLTGGETPPQSIPASGDSATQDGEGAAEGGPAPDEEAAARGSDDGDGSDTWLIFPVVLAALAAIASGGWLLYRRLRG